MVQRRGDELFLVSAAEVGPTIERHLGNPRPQPLSKAATEALAIIACKQPIMRAGIERIRGTNSDSALDTLLVRRCCAADAGGVRRTSSSAAGDGTARSTGQSL